MKKIIIFVILAFFMMCGMATAQTWHVANQRTIGWDPVTTMIDEDGNQIPIPVNDVIEYDVFTVKYNEQKANAVFYSTTTDNSVVVTFKNEGRYFVGVQSFRIPEGETERIPSPQISWSDDPVYCFNGETFGIKFYFHLGVVTGLR